MKISQFVEPEGHYKAWLLMVFASMFFVWGALGLFQTQLAISYLQRPDIPGIRSTMRRDRAWQTELRKEYRKSGIQPEDGIVFRAFDVSQAQTLEYVRDSLLSDGQLQSELKSIYGANFHEVNAVVVPCWHMHTPDTMQQSGLTPVSWEAAAKGPTGDPNISGFTIRDQLAIPVRLTSSGTPVIALNLGAFNTTNQLKLTLFHELLHAMNINGSPSKFYLFQNDLTYLPHYREYVSRTGLEGWTQLAVWLGTVILPWGLLLMTMYLPPEDASPWGLLRQGVQRLRRTSS